MLVSVYLVPAFGKLHECLIVRISYAFKRRIYINPLEKLYRTAEYIIFDNLEMAPLK